MALTPAEYQKRYRERQKAARLTAADQASPYLRRTFAQFLEEVDENDPNSVYFGQMAVEFEAVGIDLPNISEEDEIDPTTGEGFRGEHGSTGSIGKAEEMVKILRVNAQRLAELINRYKIDEIDARLAEIEGSDLSEPETRKKALADVARLTDIRRRLDKEVRYSFREISVKGE